MGRLLKEPVEQRTSIEASLHAATCCGTLTLCPIHKIMNVKNKIIHYRGWKFHFFSSKLALNRLDSTSLDIVIRLNIYLLKSPQAIFDELQKTQQ
jgi:hypothetical protein